MLYNYITVHGAKKNIKKREILVLAEMEYWPPSAWPVYLLFALFQKYNSGDAVLTSVTQ